MVYHAGYGMQMPGLMGWSDGLCRRVMRLHDDLSTNP